MSQPQPPITNVAHTTPTHTPLKGHLIVFEKPPKPGKKAKKGKVKKETVENETTPAPEKPEDPQTIEVYIPSTLK